MIALDAGHGAHRGRPYTGAAANGLVEDDLALDFVRRIGHHLRAAGHRTLYTRPDDKLVSLQTRARLAREARCDVFLSIHVNAGPPSASGVEAFAAENDTRSRKLAAELVDIVSEQGMRNRGAKWDSQSQYARLAVLRGTCKHMLAVLLEIGFITNPYDSMLLKDKHFRESVSAAIAKSCVS